MLGRLLPARKLPLGRYTPGQRPMRVWCPASSATKESSLSADTGESRSNLSESREKEAILGLAEGLAVVLAGAG